MAASPATDAAAALLGALVDLGIRHVVLSPGSRSQSLALVAAELETRGIVRLHVRIDERVAGFTALGIGRETRMPAVVICTSGTAAANLLPAALEAHHAGVPLLLLTADRPPELRGVGANQTTRQLGMFTPSTRLEADLPVPEATDAEGDGEQSLMLRGIAADAVAAALGAGTRAPGPVHLNVPFREPLGGDLPRWLGMPTAELTVTAEVDLDAAPAEEPADEEVSGALYQGGGGIGEADLPTEPDELPHVLERGPRTVVVAGADAGPDAETLAHAGGWPLIAEIVSGARFGRNLVNGYRRLLADPLLGGRIERAIVLGHPTLSREAAALLSDPDVEVLAVRGPGEPLNLNGCTAALDAVAVAVGDVDREWLGAWMQASRAAAVDLSPPAPDADGLSSVVPAERLGAIQAELAAIRAPLDRAALVDAVWRATWPHDRLMFGSSRLVRVADTVLGGKKVPVHSNRGLAGIDGTIATATGHRARVTGRRSARRHPCAARRSHRAARRRCSAAAPDRRRTAPSGDRGQRRRRHDLRRSRSRRHRPARCDGPGAVHAAHDEVRASRARVRVGVPASDDPRRARSGAHFTRRRPAAHRSPADPLKPARALTRTHPPGWAP